MMPHPPVSGVSFSNLGQVLEVNELMEIVLHLASLVRLLVHAQPTHVATESVGCTGI